MSQIIKAFLGVFLVLFLSGAAISVLSGYLEVLDAQDTYAVLLDEVENADFAPEIVRECFRECERRGYRLSVTFYYENGGVVTAAAESEVPSDTAQVELAKLAMTFPYRISFFAVHKEHLLSGFAR